jgi:acyl-CoA synthetase (AMP-forming)/AMP-acid ligase II/acyl carrier protein
MCYFFMQRSNRHIIDHLLEHARTIPHNTAFVVLEDGEATEQKVSYSDLAVSVKNMASILTAHQLRGKRVLLVYQDSLEFIVSFLAVQYAGIIPIPVSFAKGTKQVERLTSIVADAGASAILSTLNLVAQIEKGLGALLDDGNLKIISTDDLQAVRGTSIDPEPLFNDIAFIQYTSGSTGRPKGVVVTASNLMHNQFLLKDTFRCDESSVIFSWLPFHHDMGLIGNILHALFIGCKCIVMSPLHFVQRPQRWLEAISNYKVTHSGGPNFAYDLCVSKISKENLAGINLASWKVAYNGSEPVHFETMQRFASYFKQCGFSLHSFFPCYGLAEATLLVAGKKIDEAPAALSIDKHTGSKTKVLLGEKPLTAARHVVSSGFVTSGMEVKIFSPGSMLECGELEEGEICISGDSVTAGYWNKDNSTVFHVIGDKRYLKTGDLGFLYQDELFVQGRLKEMLIIRGRNFYPYDIELAASACSDAVEPNGVAVFSLPDKEDQFVIVAEIKKASLTAINAETIINTIETAVISSLGIAPHDILLTTPFGIPRTTSGKLQRVKCKDVYANHGFQVISSKLTLVKKPIDHHAHSTMLQKLLHRADFDTIKTYLLHKIESKVGKISSSTISHETDLTDMGLDSIRAMELVNVINKDLSINMDASKIFQNNSLSSLVTVIENMLWLKSSQPYGKRLTI